MDEHLRTIEELAAKYQVKPSWFYRQTMEKGPDAIPRIKIGKYLRFKESEIEQWLKDRQGQES